MENNVTIAAIRYCKHSGEWHIKYHDSATGKFFWACGNHIIHESEKQFIDTCKYRHEDADGICWAN